MSSVTIQLPGPVTGRLAVLDELKGLAIVLVVLYHAGGVLGWANTLHGDIGVDMFVILSGIGLGLSGRYEGARKFLTRRLGRIMPTYWIALTLFWALNAHFLQHHYTAWDLVLHYIGIHGWFGDAHAMSIDDSFWFITLILTLYFIYCGLQIFKLSQEAMLLVGAVISLAAAMALFYTGQASVFSHLALRLPGFFVGLLIGKLLKTGRLDLTLGAYLTIAAFLLTYVPYTQGVVFLSTIVGFAVMGAYVFAWKTTMPASVADPAARNLKFLGDHSLEIFLFHQPLIREYNFYLHARWLNDPGPDAVSRIIGMAIGITVTVIVSVELKRVLGKVGR